MMIVRRERQIPIEAKSEVDLELQLGESGEFFEIEGSTIPKSWTAAADALAEMELGKVLVIGGTDVGKSTLCAYLTNSMLSKGMRVRVIDGDIGQADIGPPTTIGSAFPSSYISSLFELEAESLIFVGNTSPNQVETPLIDGIRRLLTNKVPAITLINTDGWIEDPEAIVYKVRLISAIEPDLIIGISTRNELDPILSGSRARALRIDASEEVLKRSRSDRRELRISGYRRFLDGAVTRVFEQQYVRVRIPKHLQQLPRQELKNAIVGLLNNEGFLLGIGILIDFEKSSLRVYCKSFEDITDIEIGYVKLSTDGTELEYLTP
jgi:polynucleotide 5'-hydroxyl-kinase GRC3/NOL9